MTITFLDTDAIVCPHAVTGVFIYPFDCGKYIRCENGQTFVESCGHEMLFSKSIKVCVARSQLENTDRVGHYFEYTYGIITCPEGVEGLHQHPFEWTKYLSCQHGKTYIESCPLSQVFSISKKYCETEQNVPSSDRCNNGEYREYNYDYRNVEFILS